MITVLSIRQPWAWLIVNGYKPIENREWPTSYRGDIFIHAGKIMTKADYEACLIFIAGILVAPKYHSNVPLSLPDFEVLKAECGGIVGRAELVNCVKASDDPWFTGPFGFVMVRPRPLDFHPCNGRIGLFTLNYPPAPAGESEGA